MARVAAAIVLALLARATPADAGPITFLTALPVAQAQAIVRAQYLVVRATDDPSGADRKLTVHAVPVAIAVGATPRLAIFGVVPVARRAMEIETPLGRVTRDSAGLGDIVLFARYTVLAIDTSDATFRVAPFGGVELPSGGTGSSDELGALPRPLQPGSGSWDGLAGVAVTFQTKQWQFDADAGFKRNTGADGFRFGDEFFTDLSFQYRVWPRRLAGGVPAFLFAVVETNLVSQGRHRMAGVADPDSGGTRWDVDLGLQYVTARFIIEGIAQLPVVDEPNGAGLRGDFRISAGVRWNISLPF